MTENHLKKIGAAADNNNNTHWRIFEVTRDFTASQQESNLLIKK